MSRLFVSLVEPVIGQAPADRFMAGIARQKHGFNSTLSSVTRLSGTRIPSRFSANLPSTTITTINSSAVSNLLLLHLLLLLELYSEDVRTLAIATLSFDDGKLAQRMASFERQFHPCSKRQSYQCKQGVDRDKD